MEKQIKSFFKEKKLGSVKKVSQMLNWKEGSRYIVTCGLLRLKQYMVYEKDGNIVSVREINGQYKYDTFNN